MTDPSPGASCPADELLAAAAAGELPEAEAAPLRQHLGACPSCLAVVGALGRAEDAGRADTLEAGEGEDLGRAATWDRLPGPGVAPGPGGAAPLPERFGEFRLVRLLGKGAMGAVYLAEDEQLGRRVAIKFIQTHHTRGVRRFQLEARAIARLHHENVVTLYRAGEALGVPYQVSEYVEGQTLAELPLPLPEAEALAIARQIAAGLGAAHAVGVVHRDVKPQNIMRTAAGRVKLLDFGLARLLDALGEGPETRDGAIIGTPRYMAPETLRGAPATPQSDVCSAGIVLCELLTGERPGLVLPPRPPPGLRAEVWALLGRCLAPEPAQRPADGRALLRELEALGAAGRTARANRSLRRGLAAGVLVLAVAAVTGGLALRARRAGPAGAEAPPVVVIQGMVYLPGGDFPMGRGPDAIAAECRALGPLCDRDKLGREQPPRVVRLSPFYLDEREVDNAAFAAWLTDIESALDVRPDRDTGRPRWVYERPDRVRGGPPLLLFDLGPAQDDVTMGAGGGFAPRPGREALPVRRVTWDGARRHCAARGRRLPTEAEWERAARGRGDRRFPWGDAAPTCAGVSFDRDVGGACAGGPGADGPRPVGASPQDRTPEGIWDLGGNVAEWVQDAFLRPVYPPCEAAGRGPCADPVQEPAPGSVALEEDLRLLRGGTWEADLRLLRVSGRSRWRRTEGMTGLGFRCAASR